MDNVHACFRSCAKEGGGFRREVEDFVCLSPQLVMKYNLGKFYKYIVKTKKKVLTEGVVLGTAMQVNQRKLRKEEAGVEVKELVGDQQNWRNNSWKQTWDQWLGDYLGEITKSAAECGGVSAAVMLDLEGILVNSFGTACSLFPVEARNESTRPITELVILLGGPNGVENDYAEDMVERMQMKSCT